MVRINKFSTIQSTNVQGTEQAQTAATDQSQSEAANTPAPSANSTNTWQRASLIQEGKTQQTNLHNNLTEQSYEHAMEKVKQNKEAREESQTGSLFGTIFGGPIVGTHIGNAIETEASTETNKSPVRDLLGTTEAEVKKMQAGLSEIYDSSFVETGGGFVGDDGVQSDATDTKVSHTETKKSQMQDMIKDKEEEMKRLQEELKEATDKSSWNEFADWMSGSDGGQSEIAQATDSNPIKSVRTDASTEYYDPDPD